MKPTNDEGEGASYRHNIISKPQLLFPEKMLLFFQSNDKEGKRAPFRQKEMQNDLNAAQTTITQVRM